MSLLKVIHRNTKSTMIKLSEIFLLTLSLCLSSEATLLRVISLIDKDDNTVFTASCKWHRELIKKSPDGLEGLLINSNPPDACTEVTPPPPAPISNGSYPIDPNWFLMAVWPSADRCTLLTKVTFADSAGYAAIVVQLSANEDVASTFFSEDDWDYGLKIYPCLVSFEDGEKLKYNYSSNDDYIIHFEDESIDTWTRFFITSFLCLIAILLAIALSYCVVQMLILLIIWIRDSLVGALERRRVNRRRRLPSRQLRKIPVQLWTQDIPQDMCTICLENYVADKDKVRILPCSHVFHMACIDPWLLNQRRKCPNCKRKLVFPDEPYNSDSSTEDERAPLISRNSEGGAGGSLDHTIAGGLTFTFNESDFANHHQPIYRAIHRMMLESNARQQRQRLARNENTGEAASTSSSSWSSTASSASSSHLPSTSTSHPSNPHSSHTHPHDSVLQHAIRHQRLSRFCPRKRLPRSLFPSTSSSRPNITSINVDAGEFDSAHYLEDTSTVQELPSTSQSHNQFLAEATLAYEESLRKVEEQEQNQNANRTIGGEVEEIGENGASIEESTRNGS